MRYSSNRTEGGERQLSDVEEIESKHPVRDLDLVLERIKSLGYRNGGFATHVDEYYDTTDRRLEREDFVVRLRTFGESAIAGFKGPRTHDVAGTYRRIEIEVPAASPDQVREALRRHRLGRTWMLEKRRRDFRREGMPTISVDELPHLGFYVEIEGQPVTIGVVERCLGDAIGPAEHRNYRELLVAWWAARGLTGDQQPTTASFSGTVSD